MTKWVKLAFVNISLVLIAMFLWKLYLGRIYYPNQPHKTIYHQEINPLWEKEYDKNPKQFSGHPNVGGCFNFCQGKYINKNCSPSEDLYISCHYDCVGIVRGNCGGEEFSNNPIIAALEMFLLLGI